MLEKEKPKRQLHPSFFVCFFFLLLCVTPDCWWALAALKLQEQISTCLFSISSGFIWRFCLGSTWAAREQKLRFSIKTRKKRSKLIKRCDTCNMDANYKNWVYWENSAHLWCFLLLPSWPHQHLTLFIYSSTHHHLLHFKHSFTPLPIHQLQGVSVRRFFSFSFRLKRPLKVTLTFDLIFLTCSEHFQKLLFHSSACSKPNTHSPAKGSFYCPWRN